MSKFAKIFFIVLAFLINYSIVYSQALMWQKEYPDSLSTFADGYSTVQLEDDGYIVVFTNNFSSFGIGVMRLDKFGNLVWRKYYEGNNPRAIVKTFDGNYLLGANVLTKIDPMGNLIWRRDSIPSYQLKLSSDGGFYTCGGVQISSFLFRPYLRKYNSTGNLEWDSTYSNFYRGGVNSFFIDDEKNIILIGNFSPGSTIYDFPFIMKTDESGHPIWTRKYESDSLRYFYIRSITENIKGNYMVCGSNSLCYIVKFDSDGNWIRVRYYDGSNKFPGSFNSIAQTKDQGLVLAGSLATKDEIVKVRLLKTDYDGNHEWTKLYGIGEVSDANYATQTSDSGFIIAGRRDTFFRAQVYIIKTDENGNTNPPIGINSISVSIPDEFTLYQNYPNPFNPNTKIYFDIRKKGYTVLTVYNSLGQKIIDLISQDLNPGKFTVDINANDFGNLLPSGIYYYSLKTDNYNVSRKMLLLK